MRRRLPWHRIFCRLVDRRNARGRYRQFRLFSVERSHRCERRGGGITGGWNWQSGPVVIGFEGDVMAAGISGSERFSASPNAANPDINTMADLRLRAGVTVVPQVLLFVTMRRHLGGCRPPVSGPGGGSGNGSFFGWSIGGGAEVAFNPNWSARFDYQFTDFDSDTVSYPGGDVEYAPDVNTYRGSLIYRF